MLPSSYAQQPCARSHFAIPENLAVFCHFAALAISAFPRRTWYAEALTFIFGMIKDPP